MSLLAGPLLGLGLIRPHRWPSCRSYDDAELPWTELAITPPSPRKTPGILPAGRQVGGTRACLQDSINTERRFFFHS